MPLRFTVLGSGSGGNASLLETDGHSLLVDAGLGPRQISARLATVGASWAQVRAVLLTHTHSDHWKEPTFTHLCRHRIPLYCHAGHHPMLQAYSTAFAAMQAEGLVFGYGEDKDLLIGPSIRCRPLELRHDGGRTFGFRFEGIAEPENTSWAMAYLADLGSWNTALARAVADVDILALEFNHDVKLEYNSGRSPSLIARVLSDAGHLSNTQAAAFLRDVLQLSQAGRLRHVVQLHLSRDCNRPELAVEAARACLNGIGGSIEIHTADQDTPGPCLCFDANTPVPPTWQPLRKPRVSAALGSQPWLPGWDKADEAIA